MAQGTARDAATALLSRSCITAFECSDHAQGGLASVGGPGKPGTVYHGEVVGVPRQSGSPSVYCQDLRSLISRPQP